MFRTPIKRLRTIGIYEGISYLVLLAIAMPLKYFADFPQAVSIVGMLHGILFVLFGAALLHVWIKHRWSFLKVVAAFISSLIPFGTFVLDARLRKEEA